MKFRIAEHLFSSFSFGDLMWLIGQQEGKCIRSALQNVPQFRKDFWLSMHTRFLFDCPFSGVTRVYASTRRKLGTGSNYNVSDRQ